MSEIPAAAKPSKGNQREGVNVQVLLRCRPPNEQEIAERAPQVIQCNEALREVTLFQSAKQLSRTFTYDKVFSPKTGQEKLFDSAIVPIVDEVLDGFNCTIFAYGQTGTGKTYTMEGGPRNSCDGANLSAEAGVIPRAIKHIFDTIEANDNSDSSVKVSFLELYNEELTDLLALTEDKDAKRMRLLEDRSGVVVQGLEEVVVKSASEIYQVLDRGTAKRRTAETLLNKRSSRSHSVFTITIHMRETGPEGDDVIKIGKLNLVDLAGSENISRSGAKDDRAREAGSINQSLLTLGRVITALVEHSGHVPYRDSKLTRLLRDSLGGKTKTCIIATIAPSVHCQEETISTLDYAHRAKNIRNRPEVNQKISKATMVKTLNAEIEKLKTDLMATREKNGVYMSMESFTAAELERAQLSQAVQTLEAENKQLVEDARVQLEKVRTEHAVQLAKLENKLEQAQAELDTTRAELEDAYVKIEEKDIVLVSHQRSNAAVAQHAEGLTRELGDAASDLDALFTKLEELMELQNGDRLVMKTVADYVAQKLGQLGAAVQEAVEQQQQRNMQVNLLLAREHESQDTSIAQLSAQLQQIQSSASALLQASSQQIDSLSTQTLAGFSAVASDTDTFAKQSADAAQQACQAGAEAITKLQDALQASTQQLQAFAKQHALGSELTLRSAEQLLQKLEARLDTTQKHSVATNERSTESLQASLASLQSFKSEFDQQISQQQEQVLAQVSRLLQTFAQQGKEMVAAAVNGLGTQLAQQHTALADDTKRIRSEIDVMSADAKDLLKHLDSSSSQQAECVKQHVRENTSTVEQCCAMSADLGTQLASFQQTAVQHLNQHQKALANAAHNGQTTMEQYSKQLQQQLVSSINDTSTSCEDIQSKLGNVRSAITATTNSITASVSTCSTALEGFCTNQQQQLQDIADHVSAEVDTQLQETTDLSTMPSKRGVNVPSVTVIQALACPPEDVLLRYYRQQRATVLQHGGDPGTVRDLVTPSKFAAICHQPPASARRTPAAENIIPEESLPADQWQHASPVAKKLKFMPSKIPGLGANPHPFVNCTPRSKALADRTNY